jgi:hypothetical protein
VTPGVLTVGVLTVGVVTTGCSEPGDSVDAATGCSAELASVRDEVESTVGRELAPDESLDLDSPVAEDSELPSPEDPVPSWEEPAETESAPGAGSGAGPTPLDPLWGAGSGAGPGVARAGEAVVANAPATSRTAAILA